MIPVLKLSKDFLSKNSQVYEALHCYTDRQEPHKYSKLTSGLPYDIYTNYVAAMAVLYEY